MNRQALKQGGWLIVALVVGVGLGVVVQRTLLTETHYAHRHQSAAAAPKPAETWTCSMHPQIKLPKAGKCPICFMDLIPLAPEQQSHSDREVSVSPSVAKLMELETSTVTRTFVDTSVRMVGKVDYDETRVSVISAWVPGRLDRLFVNYTGIPVKKGDHLAEIYSPDLLTAQEELIQAVKTLNGLGQSESAIIRKTAVSTIKASREKLRLLGLSSEQIQQIEASGKATDHITLYAPSQGIVIQKNAHEGMYVTTGSPIYTVADFSTVWVKLDAYESDLQWVRYGAPVDFTTEAYPGRTFSGAVSFVDPIINPDTRTAKVRVQVKNLDLALKPGMFVRALLRARVAEDGRVVSNGLAGKWISPMHPEIVRDEPGTCDVCDMPLVSAESLGYVSAETYKAPLVIPATAALKTGKRAIVYRQVPGRESPVFEGVDVVLGPRLGDFYVVKKGLLEGDRVVTRGNFKLDAELQIQAKSSMMSENGDGVPAHHQHRAEPPGKIPNAFTGQLQRVLEGYLAIQKALAADDPKAVRSAAVEARTALSNVDMSLLDTKSQALWEPQKSALQLTLTTMQKHTALAKQREVFAQLSTQIVQTLGVFPVKSISLYRGSCSMAFDNKGAFWLQDTKQLANPYFGDMMLRCGRIEPLTIAPAGGEDHD